MSQRCFSRLLAALLLAAGTARAAEADLAARMRQHFEHEIAFREAAIHVAWGAEPLCDDTTEIEPFVLWSVHAVRRGLDADERKALKQATGMDEQWRIAWLDESAPDDLKPGDAVVAVNGRALPTSGTRLSMGAILRGSSPFSADDQAFWQVLQQARSEAIEGQKMRLGLADGREVTVDTQTGCAGSVLASAFDNEPEVFWREGHQRVKLPGNALMEAQSRDEYRWLAAFGTYFQASERAIGSHRQAEGMGSAFTVGKVLAIAVPGAGMVLSALQDKAEREITVDGLVGEADLFASEVVTALGGEPGAGLALNERLRAKQVPVDALAFSDFRRSSVELHVQQLKRLRAAQEKAEREAAQ